MPTWFGVIYASLVAALVSRRAANRFLARLAPLSVASWVAETSAAKTNTLAATENAPAIMCLTALATHACQLPLRWRLL
jgi:hypothetical protein